MHNNYFLSRRSCRSFKAEKISDELIKEIILKACKAPTCGNMQLYSVILTKEPEQLKELSKFHYNQPASTSAPLILTICADFNRFTRWCKINNADAGYNNFHSFITAMTDAVIFSQQIATIAELEGLGTCYLGTVTYNSREISRLLELPELVVPVASLAIGWPKEEGEETSRLPLESIIHDEKYKNYTDRQIEDIFKVHDEDPGNKRFIEENKKENLAQVFAEVRYPRETNEKISETFYNLIKEQGF